MCINSISSSGGGGVIKMVKVVVDLYSSPSWATHLWSAQVWITQIFTLQTHHTSLQLVSVHQTAPPPLTVIAVIRLQLTTHLSCLQSQ